MNISLSSTFRPFHSGPELQFESFCFAGGEPHIRILSPESQVKDQHIQIATQIQSGNDLLLVALTVDALNRMGVRSFDLFIPYFPAARQDRLMTPGEPLSVKVYAHLINSLKANKVWVYDPHSDVTRAVLDRVEAIDNTSFVASVLAKMPKDIRLIAPDAGAVKKIFQLSQRLGGIPVITCQKRRDVRNGQISHFDVFTDDLQGKPCLIVDDICDGGRTFIGLAKHLKAKGAGSLYLAVSHGIFSRGLSHLCTLFKQIYCTDAFHHGLEHDQLNTISITLSKKVEHESTSSNGRL